MHDLECGGKDCYGCEFCKEGPPAYVRLPKKQDEPIEENVSE